MKGNCKYTYEFSFLPFGSNFQREKYLPGELWIDVGSSLEDGVIDHHYSVSHYESTVEALLSNEGREVLEHLTPQKGRIHIYLHRDPDLDAFFSVYLLIFYLEHDRTLPYGTELIKTYVSDIDSGRFLLDGENFSHLYALVSGIREVTGLSKEETFDVCMELVETAAIKLATEENFSLYTSDLTQGNALLSDVSSTLALDLLKYQEDVKSGICKEKMVFLPLKGEDIVSDKPVKTLVWFDVPGCIFHKMWARRNGYQLTVIPQENFCFSDGELSYPCTNVIIALNPVDADGNPQSYSILPIAKYLEEYEQECELKLLGDKNSAKRNHSRPRGNTYSQFYEKPFLITGDPWFVNSTEDLVAAPGSGSLLSIRQIIDVVLNLGECYVKSCNTKLITGFSFDRSYLKEINKMIDKSGWCSSLPSDYEINYENLNYMLKEFSDWHNKGSRFRIYRNPKFNQTTLIIYQYGVGLILEESNDVFEKGKLFHTTYDQIRDKYKEIIHATIGEKEASYYFNCYDPVLERLHFIGKNIYSSVDVDSSILNMKRYALSYYAKKLCNFFGNNDDYILDFSLDSRVSLAFSSRGTILFTTTDSYSGNLIETEYRNHFEKEWFYLYLTALQQRYLLTEITRKLVSIGYKNAKKVKQLKETLITFYGSGYFSTASDDELCERIFRFYLEKLEVEQLKECISNHIAGIDEYNESHSMRAFNQLSMLILPVVVLSTVFQTSIIRLEPLWQSGRGVFGLAFNTDTDNMIAWGLMFVLSIILFAILILNGKRRR